MNHSNLINRIARKASRTAFRLFGVDNITQRRVQTRSDLERLGSKYGGWFVPATLLDDRSICYCVGCGEDITFDLALIDRFGCRVYGFDPTPRAIEHVTNVAGNQAAYVFSPVGLWKEDSILKFFEPKDPSHVSHSALNLQKTDAYFEAKVNRLGRIMADNGHAHLDLLKLDIEGAEYAVLDSILEDRLRIDILCVEFDEYFQPLDDDYRARIAKAIDSLCLAGFAMVHAEGNGNYTFIREPRVSSSRAPDSSHS